MMIALILQIPDFNRRGGVDSRAPCQIWLIIFHEDHDEPQKSDRRRPHRNCSWSRMSVSFVCDLELNLASKVSTCLQLSVIVGGSLSVPVGGLYSDSEIRAYSPAYCAHCRLLKTCCHYYRCSCGIQEPGNEWRLSVASWPREILSAPGIALSAISLPLLPIRGLRSQA